MAELYSSLFNVAPFATDRQEVVLERIRQHPSMKLVTVEQDPELHEKLRTWGIDDRQSFNLYDWLQGALDYDTHAHDQDARVLPQYDKHEIVIASVTDKDGTHGEIKYDNDRMAELTWRAGHIAQTKQRNLYTYHQDKWATDIYDSRGFLSRRQYFNPDGKLGMETIFHVDGTPVMEISHMGDKTMYRLLGTHGLPNWILSNELSVMLWWFDKIVKQDQMPIVYNDDPLLDAVWVQLTNRLKLIEVAHAENMTQERIATLRSRDNVVVVNQEMAKTYHYPYLDPFEPVGKVHADKNYDRDRVVIVGRWLDDASVENLVATIKALKQQKADLKIDLTGYFSTESQKVYAKAMEDAELAANVTMRGNVQGPLRTKVWQQAAVALIIEPLVGSGILAAELNHAGVPVVTNIAGYRGAMVNDNKVGSFVAGVMMGLDHTDLWHQDVKQNAR